MPGSLGLPELIISLVVMLVVFGGNRLAAIGGALGTAASQASTGVTDASTAFDRVPARAYQVGSRPGSMAELFGLGVDGMRWPQVAVLMIGTIVAHNINLMLRLASSEQFDPTALPLLIAVPAFFVFAAITAVRSFQNSLAVAATAGVLVALFEAAVRHVATQSVEGADAPSILGRVALIPFVAGTLDMLALQFAVSGRHRWGRMTIGLFVVSVAVTYVAIGVWADEWNPEVLMNSPLVFETAVLSAIVRTVTFWFGQAVFGTREDAL